MIVKVEEQVGSERWTLPKDLKLFDNPWHLEMGFKPLRKVPLTLPDLLKAVPFPPEFATVLKVIRALGLRLHATAEHA